MILISRSKSLLDKYIQEALEKKGFSGLVSSHGELIIVVAEYKNGIIMKDLAKLIGKDPSTVSSLVKKLEKNDYVSLSKSEIDQRSRLVKLKSKGWLFLEVITDISNQLFDLIYNEIEDDNRIVFRTTLNKIINNLVKEM